MEYPIPSGCHAVAESARHGLSRQGTSPENARTTEYDVYILYTFRSCVYQSMKLCVYGLGRMRATRAAMVISMDGWRAVAAVAFITHV
jgi:hypothetical protein